jgi:hypothetical protein
MATTKAVDLINRVSITLQDPTFVRWTQGELLNYLNDAQRQVVLFRPDAKAVNAPFTCVNSAKQTLPADGLRLISVLRNTGGRAITKVDRSILDVQLPTWYETAVGTDGVKHYVYDALDPKNFYVFPKPAAAYQIDIIYAMSPVDIVISNYTTDTQVIGIDDIYANALMDYMMYRAYQKDSEFANLNRAAVYYQAFTTSLGIKSQADGGLLESMVAQQPRRTAQ